MSESLKGRYVRVIRGKKVPQGTEGEVFWEGSGKYGVRVGLKDAEGTVHWTSAGNVEEIEPPEDYVSPGESAAPSASKPVVVEVIETGDPSIIALKSPYNMAFVDALKAAVPWRERTFNRDTKAWEVSHVHRVRLRELCREHYPGATYEVVKAPQGNQLSPDETEEWRLPG